MKFCRHWQVDIHTHTHTHTDSWLQHLNCTVSTVHTIRRTTNSYGSRLTLSNIIDSQVFLTGRFISKFAVKRLLNMQLHLQCIATQSLPCKIILLKNCHRPRWNEPPYRPRPKEVQSLRKILVQWFSLSFRSAWKWNNEKSALLVNSFLSIT